MRKLPEGMLEIKEKYWSQLDQAKRRNIPWLFTFESWYQYWLDSGHWHKRGRRKGQYVMSRPGDKGPYAPWNVRIVKVEENSIEGNLPGHHQIRSGYQHSESTRAKISAKASGRPRSEIAKINTSKTLRENYARKKAGLQWVQGQGVARSSSQTIPISQ